MGTGTGLAKRSNGRHDQSRIQLLQYRIVHIQPLQVSWWERFYKEISLNDEPLQDLSTFLFHDVQSDSALTGVIGHPKKALLRVGVVTIEGTHSPRWIATRWFYLDNIGSEVSEYFAGK
jgi:hypothetical protein